jgi:hypothetical protein
MAYVCVCVSPAAVIQQRIKVTCNCGTGFWMFMSYAVPNIVKIGTLGFCRLEWWVEI